MIEAVVALPVALVLGAAARWAGSRVGALDRPDRALKPHATPVSYLGGLAVAGGVAAGLAARGWPLPATVAVALFGPVALGLVDDARHVPAPARLAVQVGLALTMAAGGLAATALPGGKAVAWAGAALLYTVAANAVNMVDGMDGLAAGTTVVSAAAVALVARGEGRPGVVAVALAAAALAFLWHNLPPARLFLGDNGSYFIGAALAVAMLQAGRTVPGLAGAVCCLGFFLLDFGLSVLRRLAGRAPLFHGDRGHLYDQLRARGMSMRGVLGVCYGANVALCAAGVAAARLSIGGALLVTGLAWTAAMAALFTFGFVGYRARVA